MKKLIKKKLGFILSETEGFTLIEILVVIGIIAILAGIVLIAINPARQFKQANDTQRTSNVNTILNAIGHYIADNKGAVPAGISTTTVGEISSTGANHVDLCATLVPVYMSSFPVDPGVDSDDAGSLKTGEAIPPASCSSAYKTGYDVAGDINGRITVSAHNVEMASTTIAVTR